MLRVVTWVTCAWAFFYPHPYELAIAVLALIPVVAAGLAAIRPGSYSLEGRRDDPRPELATALVVPAAVLVLRVLIDLEILDWSRLWWITAAISVVWMAGLLATSPELRRLSPGAVCVLLLAGVHAFGVAALANACLDESTPTIYATHVLGKHVDTGKTIIYYLDVAPWGPRESHEDVSVTRALYTRVDRDAVVCVRLWAGALGVRWFDVTRCASG